MIEIRGRTFTNEERVEVDGKQFVDCRFESVVLVYRGGEHPSFESCALGAMDWHFEGAALKTIQLLQLLGLQNSDGQFLASIFKPGLVFADQESTSATPA